MLNQLLTNNDTLPVDFLIQLGVITYEAQAAVLRDTPQHGYPA